MLADTAEVRKLTIMSETEFVVACSAAREMDSHTSRTAIRRAFPLVDVEQQNSTGFLGFIGMDSIFPGTDHLMSRAISGDFFYGGSARR